MSRVFLAFVFILMFLSADAGSQSTPSSPPSSQSAPAIHPIDINHASSSELKSVPGIGDAYAAKIMAGRPYKNKSQLKSRGILPAEVYEKVKDYLVARQN